MRKRLAAVIVLVAASVGALAAPAAAATACSYLFCYEYTPTSATAWTNVGPISGTVTLQTPLFVLLPPPTT